MLVIIIPAALIAALICFRWARTLAAIGFVAIMIWFIASPAHAQSAPIVQCDIGEYGRYRVADYVCDAMALGYAKIDVAKFGQRPPDDQACEAEMNRYVHAPPGVIFTLCNRMWRDNVQGQAVARFSR